MAGAITAILCGKLITGLPGPVLKNAVVEVADHKIVAIGSTVPAAVVDLSYKEAGREVARVDLERLGTKNQGDIEALLGSGETGPPVVEPDLLRDIRAAGPR